ncbi:hypothetical protein [Embleya sp. NBC_00896]|uniref:hypothetical protein n=1 Tax=Embleya sp. NBC_00896 TaxID=2975961 RepID=UPI00386E258C|nr:hypothetical protein OG928_07260 [Embleya sp. NBC_00896]
MTDPGHPGRRVRHHIVRLIRVAPIVLVPMLCAWWVWSARLLDPFEREAVHDRVALPTG